MECPHTHLMGLRVLVMKNACTAYEHTVNVCVSYCVTSFVLDTRTLKMNVGRRIQKHILFSKLRDGFSLNVVFAVYSATIIAQISLRNYMIKAKT